MAKKFISLLGVGNYKTCTYYLGEEKAKPTSFVQEALIELLCKDWTEQDKAIIFLTEGARIDNWYNEYDVDKRLKDRLINRKFGIQILDSHIEDGKDIDEIWTIFEAIMNTLEDGDEVIFDITNSFRSIPMLALSVLNYAKVVKNIKISGIYYGAFDPFEFRGGKDEFQIVDLTSLDEILEWTQAINSFLRYGNGEHIKDLSSLVLRDRVKSRDVDSEAREMKMFVGSLNDFTRCIYTCRGRFIGNKKIDTSKNSIQKSYINLQNNIDNIIGNQNQAIKPLVPLFNKVEERIKDFNNNSNLSTGLAVIDWSIANNLIQQGYTALEETIVTYVCRQFNLDDTNKFDRNEIVNNAINIKCYKIDEDKWIVKPTKKDKVEAAKEIEHAKIQIREIVRKINKELYGLIDKVKKYRNDINHFGFSDGNSRDYETLARELKNFRDDFLTNIKENSVELYEEIAAGL